MLWFFGSLAIVSVVALIVGLNVEMIFIAKIVGAVGCLIAGMAMSIFRDRYDNAGVLKLFMFAIAAMTILVGKFVLDMVTKDGFRILGSGVGIMFTSFFLLFIALTIGLVVMYWRDRESSVTMRVAMATSVMYILPAVILTPMVIYL